MTDRRRVGWLLATLLGGAALEALLVRLGRTYGATRREQAMSLPGDEILADPDVMATHAISIDAPVAAVWPWLLQMGWNRGGWYTARWVDRALLLRNRASADRIIPELQDTHRGSVIPNGPPSQRRGLVVERLEPQWALVLHSTSRLGASWWAWRGVSLDWSWAYVLIPLDGGSRTRFVLRSRWITSPWWLTLGGRLGVLPADFVMSRDMLRGIKWRSETLHAPPAPDAGPDVGPDAGRTSEGPPISPRGH